MKLTRMASALAAALSLGLASQASLAQAGPLDLSSGSTGFSNTPSPGGFADVFTFSLSSAGTIGGSLTSLLNGLQDLDFFAIYLTGPSGVFSFTQVLADPFETWALAPTFVAAGAYSLSVIGLNSAAAGSYGGNLAVSPVPEPDSYALLLAGMVAIGIWSRRRVP